MRNPFQRKPQKVEISNETQAKKGLEDRLAHRPFTTSNFTPWIRMGGRVNGGPWERYDRSSNYYISKGILRKVKRKV